MRMCKPDVKYSFQQGLFPVAHAAFSTKYVTSVKLLRKLCLFFLFISPLRIRHRKPYSLQRERGQSGLKPSWQPFAGPQPHPCPRTAAKGLAAWPWRRARRAWGKGRRTTVEDSIKRRIGRGRRGTEEQSKFREIWGHIRMTVYIKEAYGALSHRGPVLCYSG